MNTYVDLLIVDNDLAFDPSHQPRLIDGLASIAQDIAHLIRESGLLVELVAERDPLRRRDCLQRIELLVEDDQRLVPGTVRITQPFPGTFHVTANSARCGAVEVTL